MSSALVMTTTNLALGGLVFLLGLVILRENPRQRLNRVVAMMLFFGSVGAILGATSVAGVAGGAAGAARPDLLRNFAYVWEFYFPTLFYFASIFPTERGYARRFVGTRFAFLRVGFGAAVFAPHAFHLVLMVALSVWHPTLLVPHEGWLQYFAPVLGLLRVFLGLFLGVHQALFSLVNLGYGLATMALLFDSFRQARMPRLRRQLGVIAGGLSASLVLYALASFASVMPRLLGVADVARLRSTLTILALTVGSGSIAFAIVRYKFLDTRVLARRGILYALAAAALVVFYVLVVSRLNRLATEVSGVDSRVFEPVFLLLTLALFQPLVSQLEELLDRWQLKDPSDYRNVLRRLGRELQTTIDLEVLLTRTIGTLAEAMLLQRAHVLVFGPEGTLVRTGAGRPLSEDEIGRVAAVLPRLPLDQSSFRLAERLDGVGREEHRELTRGLGLALIVPLRWGGRLLGAVLLGEKVTGIAFTSEDVSLLTTLAAQVSVSLENAFLLRDRVSVARFEQELNLARQIQRASLLSEFPPIPRFEVDALYVPSREVGGDFYDVVPTGDGGWLVAIADVSGKGVPAALLSAMLQASLRTQADGHAELPTILGNINGLMYRSTTTQQFATFFLARIDSVDFRMRFSNAGHNWPIVVRHGGGREFLERGGTVLGILDGTTFDEGEVALTPGDLVLLYTDGITEATNADGELFGEERLCACVEALPPGLGAQQVTAGIYAEVRRFLGPVEPQDDLTLLVVRALEPVPAAGSPPSDREAVAAG